MPIRLLFLLLALLSACATPLQQSESRRQTSSIVGPDNAWYADAQTALTESIKRPPDYSTGARNVILFIGDGMSLQTVTAARIREGQLRGANGEENLLSFESFPHTGFAKVYNTNAQVPDSAGTATAMLSGVKTIMGVIGVDDGVRLADCSSLQGHSVPTLLEHAEKRGLASGIISTARITHATPASAYAHSPARDWEDNTPEQLGDCVDIARQLVEFDIGDGPEVVLGGGRAPFLPASTADPEYAEKSGWRTDERNLIDEWQQRYPQGQFVWNRSQFDQVPDSTRRKLMGLFEPSHMQFESDRDRSAAGEPSLAEMVRKAVSILQHHDQGYFLLVEAGRIDHAHHHSNAYRALEDTIALSDAVRVARELSGADETLIIVTADHGHVMEITGYPRRGNPILDKVRPAGSTEDSFSTDASGRPYTTLIYANGPGYTGASDLLPEGPKHLPHAPQRFEGIRTGRPDLTTVDTENLEYQQESAIPTTYETHSGADVPVYADGPGAWLVQGVNEQNYLFHVIAHALFGPPR